MKITTISALILTKDNTKEALDIIKEIYDSVDEIVLLDQSDAANKSLIARVQKSQGLTKLHVYDLLSLGYVEPLREFGVQACRSEWILSLDVGQKLSASLKSELKAFLNGTEHSAFRLRLNKNMTEGFTGLVDYQVRLYRKGRIHYKGYIHEAPLINGSVGRLPDRFYLDNQEVYGTRPRKVERYLKIESFTRRLTYAGLSGMLRTSFLRRIPAIYAALKGLNSKDELTRRDYKILAAASALSIGRIILKAGHLPRARELRWTYTYLSLRAEYFWSVPEPERRLQLEICEEIRKSGGVIKYLELDRMDVLERLTKESRKADVDSSADLFIRLLKERHSTGSGYYLHPDLNGDSSKS